MLEGIDEQLLPTVDVDVITYPRSNHESGLADHVS